MSDYPMIDRRTFIDPPARFRGAYFWSINDSLDPDRLREQIRQMKLQGQGGAFFHARDGLPDTYLADRFLRSFEAALDECTRLGMYLWLYDEDRFPSGFAGGFVVGPAPGESSRVAHPEHAALQLVRAADGRIAVEAQAAHGRFNGQPYTDLSSAQAVARFHEVGYEPYRHRFESSFGETIPGIFTDEPAYFPVPPDRSILPWGHTLEEVFRDRKGYEICDHLTSLFEEVGDYRAVRFDYWDVMTTLFEESFTSRTADWCESNGLLLTGHFWEHAYPDPRMTGSVMNNYAKMQVPGIDLLFHPDFRMESGERHFGNILIVKEASSIGHQLKKRRVMSETHGGSGWDLDFAAMKRTLDFQFALGVNMIVQHLFHYSLRGRRKRDFPPSFGSHQPWWQCYRYLGDYIGRLSCVLSAGEPVADVLVVHNATSTWTENGGEQLRVSMDSLLSALAAAQVWFELGDETVMAHHGSVDHGGRGPRLQIGASSYRVVVLPAMTTLRSSTIDLLSEFVDSGGPVFLAGSEPSLEDGRRTERPKTLLSRPSVHRITSVEAMIDQMIRIGVEHLGHDQLRGPAENLFSRRQRLHDEDLLFLCNVNANQTVSVRLPSLREEDWTEWNAMDGVCRQRTGDLVDLPPATSLLLQRLEGGTSSKAGAPRVSQRESHTIAIAPQSWEVTQVSHNVLPLKRCAVRIAGHQELGVMNAISADGKLRAILGLEPRSATARQPWMIATDRPGTPVHATYTFSIDGDPPETAFLAVEDPGRISIRLNGQPVQPDPDGTFHLDPAFRLCPAAASLRSGKNSVEVEWSDYGEDDAIEWLYIVGGFTVREGRIGPNSQLEIGEWTTQGRPYFSGTVRYSATFVLPQDSTEGGTDDSVARGALFRTNGLRAVACELVVNGEPAGILAIPPHSAEVGNLLRPGENRLELVVHNSAQNMLGPHDASQPRGFAAPDSFDGESDTTFAPTCFDGVAEIAISDTL